MSDEPMDWQDTPEPVMREVLKEGERFLSAQLQCATAADQRATAFTGVLVTLSAAVVAAAVALWDRAEGDALAGMLAMSAFLLLAAFCSAWAARPIAFFLPGSRPDQWHECRNDPLPEMLAGAVENVQLSIDENEAFADRNADAFGASLGLSVMSPLIGALVWWLA